MIVINFANPDMVGHTGVIPAAVAAVERVDSLVGDAVQAIRDVDGILFICADHGNAEQMIDYETGEPHTAPYDQSGSVYPGERRSLLWTGRGRMSGGHCPDPD